MLHAFHILHPKLKTILQYNYKFTALGLGLRYVAGDNDQQSCNANEICKRLNAYFGWWWTV